MSGVIRLLNLVIRILNSVLSPLARFSTVRGALLVGSSDQQSFWAIGGTTALHPKP